MVRYAEAEVVTFLDVSNTGISDLTGIWKFINLEELWCFSNQLSKLDISRNKALEVLYCQDNKIYALDVSVHAELEQLDCSYNPIFGLDVSKNIFLRNLFCSANQLINLNVSRNFELWNLFFESMPSLTAICVWELPFPPEGATAYMEESPDTYFSTEYTHQN